MIRYSKIVLIIVAIILLVVGVIYYKKSESQPEVIMANKLESCTAYGTTFKHPLTGEIIKKEVVGIVDGKCDYVEQLPYKREMVCKFSDEERKSVANSYKDDVNIFLQEAIDAGVCKIVNI